MKKCHFEKQIITNLYDVLNDVNSFHLNIIITGKVFENLWYRNFITDLFIKRSFYNIERLYRLYILFKIDSYESGESK